MTAAGGSYRQRRQHSSEAYSAMPAMAAKRLLRHYIKLIDCCPCAANLMVIFVLMMLLLG